MHMLSILILVLALSMDALVASIAYGANRVSLSIGKILAMNLICSGFLGLALGAGSVIDGLVPEHLTRIICFISLAFLGVIKLLDYSIREYIRHHQKLSKDLSFSVSGVSVIVRIYSDPMEADWDRSKSLSWREILFLSAAMSIDSLVAGTLAAFMKVPVLLTVGISFLVGTGMVSVGLYLGRKLSDRVNCDLSWLSGVLFLILAVTKSFS